jgi:hypothetical protein
MGWRSYILVSGKSESAFVYAGGLHGIVWYMKTRFGLNVVFPIAGCDPMRAFPKAVRMFNPLCIVWKDWQHVRTLALEIGTS